MRKDRLYNFILVLGLLAGIALLLYPTLSNRWNERHQSRAIINYVTAVNQMDESTSRKLLADAEDFNRRHSESDNYFWLSAGEKAEYETILNINGDSIMGYLEIPMLNVSLPIYHGTSNAVLEIGAGHMEFSSLPIGGIDTHCVISGHRGLPSAKLFSDLDKLTEGDIFNLRVLNQVLTYQVDQILIVEPAETDALGIVPGMDLCTLVTCTPYGVNSHRLLVRGTRVDGDRTSSKVSSDAIQIEKRIITPILTSLILLITIAIIFTSDSIRNRRKRLHNMIDTANITFEEED